MSNQIADTASRLQQPDYTGENRCVPCTVVNVVIATVAACVLAVLSIPAGLLLFGGSLFAIYFRGYLVPGTPHLTKRYLPPAVLRLFGKEPLTERSTYTVENPEDLDVGTALAGIGALAGIEETDEPSLAPTFRDQWHERIRDVREQEPQPEDVAGLFDVEGVNPQSTTSFALSGGIVRWDSEAALIADIAAGDELRVRLDGWDDLDRSARRDLLAGLRLALDFCPVCEHSLTVEEHQLDPCCQKPHTVVQSLCEACDVAIAEVTVMGTDEKTSARVRFLRS